MLIEMGDFMYYILFTLLFLKFSFKKEDVKEQIVRAEIGGVISFAVFYLFNKDRSLSLILSIIWIPAVFQLILTSIFQDIKKQKISKFYYLVAAVFMVFSFCYNLYPYITGSSKKLAQMVPVKESSDMVSKIDAEHVIIISPETAYYKMQKLLGTLPNPSIYRIGELGITMTKDGACYVAPIEVDGFFRALSNKEIPGVMYISAERNEEAKIINIPVGYADSFVFGRDLKRHLRSYKPDKVLFQANAELDDEGNPYYVGSYGHYAYGRKGPVIDGVLLLSFKDGKVTDYSKEKVPSWVDEVYPSDVSEDYNKFFGTLKEGLWNKLITKKGVHIPTQWGSMAEVKGLELNSSEVIGVIDGEKKLKWFTDHTNTSDTSTTMTGYTLMDMRNGNMIYYKTPGYINGKGAMNVVSKALGANSMNWTPAQPIFYNLFGTEAWVVPVINKTDGAFIKLGIVAAQSSYVVLEDSKDAAIESFKNAIAYGLINSSTGANANSIKAEEKSITGKVLRINPVTENGNTVFYLRLEGVSTIFMVNKSTGVDITLTRDGDNVEIRYLDIKGNNVVSTTYFKNNSIK